LDEEQRRWIRSCLTKAGLKKPGRRDFKLLVPDIEREMALFASATAKLTFRQRHDALRSLWHLADRSDPPIGMIRRRIARLPAEALNPIDERACRIIPVLEGRDRHLLDNESRAVDFQTWLDMGGFQKWAANADGALLVEAVKLCVATGSAVANAYTAALEPRILGVVRRGPGQKPAGGRPRARLNHTLVKRLAYHWHRRTGKMPEQGRSDETGFGDLVHRVFQWLGRSHEEATYALRAYWSAFRCRERERELAIVETD
jgi:hypothetical protein